MTTKARLERGLEEVKGIYSVAKELEDIETAKLALSWIDLIKKQLNHMCYQCKVELRRYNVYYCSEECNDKYYPMKKGSPKSIQEMQRALLEMKKRSHL